MAIYVSITDTLLSLRGRQLAGRRRGLDRLAGPDRPRRRPRPVSGPAAPRVVSRALGEQAGRGEGLPDGGKHLPDLLDGGDHHHESWARCSSSRSSICSGPPTASLPYAIELRADYSSGRHRRHHGSRLHHQRRTATPGTRPPSGVITHQRPTSCCAGCSSSMLKMGAAGAALATVSGQAISAGMSVYFFFSERATPIASKRLIPNRTGPSSARC